MSRRWPLALVITAFAAPAPAQNYTYTKIALTSDGVFDFIGSGVAINASGSVSFLGESTVDGDGIYVGTASGVALVANATTPPPSGSTGFDCFCDGMSINGAGKVAFSATVVGPPGQGVYVGTTSTVAPTVVADTSTSVPTPMPSGTAFVEFGTAAINGSGQVAFTALIDPPGTAPTGMGVYVGTPNAPPGSGYAVATVAVTGEGATDFVEFSDPAINASGKAAFFGARNDNSAITLGVYLGSAGGPLDTVALSGGGQTDFLDFGSRSVLFPGPAVNDAGQVAFTAELVNGKKGVYVRTVGGNEAAVVTSGTNPGDFETFGDPSINTAGRVAFWAELDGGGEGIYTNLNAITELVIQTGQSLEVRPGETMTVEALDTSRFALADDGRVAFRAILSDGMGGMELGLFIATPVPEPGLLFGVAAVGLAAARQLRRR